MTERDEMLNRLRELAAKKAEHGLTSAEAYEMQGIEEALDHQDELAAMQRA